MKKKKKKRKNEEEVEKEKKEFIYGTALTVVNTWNNLV